ncbi:MULTISPECIES: N-acetyltransferase [unclassified Ruegeria]|uniref:GNAT family N-acetyltransferase n=1 Tax=unclassified Ruegeria TaxID=2625375 RepID=UPI001ADB024A|nr:N-acetyltransferase [Ruegeria sp. R8_1]MBO9414224.1 N-acetyltransferase [Ruegeria sp. R8_2]
MQFSSGVTGMEAEIPEFFRAVFSASEGSDEGEALKALTVALIKTTEADDLLCVTAHISEGLCGCIFFSRLTYDEDPRKVVLMSPVAVATDRQKQGIGQKLIAYGLEQVRQAGAEVAVTYGDPAYYGKSGFQAMTPEFARPPHDLSQPHGWLGQSLNTKEFRPIVGPSRCVPAFDQPGLW